MTTRFEKGKSGNPKGKPTGAKDKRTELRALLQPHAAGLLQKAVDMALEGDPAALRMCLDRLIPTIKATAEPVKCILPTTGTLADQGAAIYQAVARGEIGTDEAVTLMQVLQAQCRIVEISEFEARLAALEQGQGATNDRESK